MPRRLLVCLTVSLLAGCQAPSRRSPERAGSVGEAATARKAQRSAPRLAVERRVQPRISLAVRGVSLEKTLGIIAQQIGWNIVLEPGVSERVTIALRDIAWRRALELILKQTRCEAKPLGTRTLYVSQPPRVSMSFH